MRTTKFFGLFLLLLTSVAISAPRDAEALFRVGVDGRWVPLAVESNDSEQVPMDLGAGRQLSSTGVGARFLLGFDYFSIGPKLNFARHVFEDRDQSFSQLDVNAHLRMRIPTARLAIFAEAGPAIALDLETVGYNGLVGVEVDVLGWPLLDLNLGLALQYVNLPISTGPSSYRVNEGFRAMVVVGFDLTLQGLGNSGQP